MKRKKVEKLLRELERTLRDEMWLTTNPPKFNPGDEVLWYENPCWTSDPEDAPKPILMIIVKEVEVMPGDWMNYTSEDGVVTYSYLCPHRLYLATKIDEPTQKYVVLEHACYKKGDKI